MGQHLQIRVRSEYLRVVEELRQLGLAVQTGVFGANMQVELVNDGPVTILISSKKEF